MFFPFFFCNFAPSMKTRKLHIRIFAFLLLLSMLKVAFPVGEFFHNHHSGKELCTHAHQKKCTHESHLSQGEKPHDCMFFQLHQSFIFTPFVFQFFSFHTIFIFSLSEGKTLSSFIHPLLRGPPLYNV